MDHRAVKLLVLLCLWQSVCPKHHLHHGHHHHLIHHHLKDLSIKPTKKFDIIQSPKGFVGKTEIEVCSLWLSFLDWFLACDVPLLLFQAKLKVVLKGLDGVNGDDGALVS